MPQPMAKTFRTATLLAAAALMGCAAVPAPSGAAPAATADGPPPVPAEIDFNHPAAKVAGDDITYGDLERPLIEAYGLNVLLQVVQLKLARQDAIKANVIVSPEDIAREREETIKGAFPEAEPKDYPELLNQLLQRQQISRPQFDMAIETNAILRKVAVPMCKGKITEENIKQAFDLQYGAKVQIRDVKLSNLAEAQEAKRRLADGEAFEKVAGEMSHDPQTRAVGGLWPPFGATNTEVSQAIKDQAFGLKPGEVSDAIGTEGSFHVIQVVKRIEPRVAKLDGPTHDYLEKQLTEKLVLESMKVLRARITQQALIPGVLEIRDPVLKQQFQARLEEAKREAADQQKQNNVQRGLNGLIAPATQQSALPSPQPGAASPSGTEARDRPPATKSGG